MIETVTQSEVGSANEAAPDHSLQAWVSPAFERIPLNEAMNTLSFIPGADATTTYS